jgi:hypothetical protein
LPNVHVARQLVGREIQRLQGRIDGINRELARGTFGVNGMQVPHLVQQHAEAREELVRLRGEIDRLESLSDLEARQFAADKGYR